MVRPLLVEWLQRRALRLPGPQREELARRLGVSQGVVDEINDAVAAFVVGEVQAARL